MPYKKRFRNQSKSTRYMNTAQKALSTGTAALMLARQIKGLVNVEKHRHLITTTATNITNTGSMTYLTAIAQGDNAADRQGNSLLVKGISSKLYMYLNNSGTIPAVVRVIYFIDLQQVADGSPAVTDVLESASVTAPLNRTNVGRFKVIKQYYTMLNPGGKENQIKNDYIKLNHHVRYNGSATTDIQKGGLYRLTLSNLTSIYPIIEGDEIVQFYDN